MEKMSRMGIILGMRIYTAGECEHYSLRLDGIGDHPVKVRALPVTRAHDNP